MEILEQPVSVLKGVGPKAGIPAGCGNRDPRDLLHCFPREHEDRTYSFTLAQLPHGRRAGTRAVVTGSPRTKRVRKGFTLTRCL